MIHEHMRELSQVCLHSLTSSHHYSEFRLRLREETSLTLVSRAWQRMSQEELLLTKLEKVDDDLVKITTTGDCFA